MKKGNGRFIIAAVYSLCLLAGLGLTNPMHAQAGKKVRERVREGLTSKINLLKGLLRPSRVHVSPQAPLGETAHVTLPLPETQKFQNGSVGTGHDNIESPANLGLADTTKTPEIGFKDVDTVTFWKGLLGPLYLNRMLKSERAKH